MIARTRMILAWLAFFVWVGWLATQSYRYGRFPVVSRAQLSQADFAVVAVLKADANGQAERAIKVIRMAWPAGDTREFAGQTIEVANLPDCSDFAGPGDYVVPLTLTAKGGYELARTGRSPLMPAARRPSIYPASDVVMRQLEQVPKSLENKAK
ncbi:MAG: hypothetical protein K1X57_13705 [Gemmataceae bacterium]|nr:hypothetical protein [Gemmataceae bacterium]